MPRNFQWTAVTLACLLVSPWAQAQLTAIVAVEPTAKKAAHTIVRSALETGLTQAAGQPLKLSTSEDLADVMRATRSAGYDVFIGPAQVAASALQRGYELVGATQKSEQYLLIGAANVPAVAAMKGQRLYLPQQDSVYTYMARGMLNEAGLSFQDLKSVKHEKYPQAGLSALSLGVADATVVRADEWAEWSAGRSLRTTIVKPPGTGCEVSSGLTPVTQRPDAQEYRRVAELGLFTPNGLPGVTRISAKEAQQLQAQGAVVVDTRTEKEFKAKRIRGAVLAAYVEKSLKDVAFNAAQDDFQAFDKVSLDKTKPVIFACNGAECWKSYKAAKVAAAKGFKSVYWLRGGLPEWDAGGLPTEGG